MNDINFFLLCVTIVLLIGIMFLLMILIIRRKRQGVSARDLREQLDNRMTVAVEQQQRQIREESEYQQRRMREQLENQQKRIQDHLDHIAGVRLRDQMGNVASEVLQLSTDRLRDENARQFEDMLRPIREKLDEFSSAVRDSYVKDNASRQSLSDQIANLVNLNRTIGEEARELSRALKGDSKVQGDWGEMVLETLLESAGMKRNINYFTQVTTDQTGQRLRSDEGRLQRPDVVVLMPDNHRLVIDSKVSLTAYSRYAAASTEEERAQEGRAHIRSVKKHIDELGCKQYQNSIPNAAEHVLMFMPVEGAYLTAVELDPDLWRYAFERNVVIVSPTHIFSVVQILGQLWRQEKQSRHAEQIAQLGGLLYDRFASFVSEFEAVERQLEQTRKAYDKCRNALTGGPQSVVRRAERLRDLGARTSRRIPQKTLDEALASPSNPSDEGRAGDMLSNPEFNPEIGKVERNFPDLDATDPFLP